jgi:2-polyprenyl-6-methoxyphenol hydroxylase-like FAD-dependent oxidoreductase
MPVQSVIVLGAGIAGLAAALALTKHNRLRVQIYELRSGPSPLGGAINLTPNAMRLLDHLGVVRGGALENVGARVPRIEIFSLRDGRPRAQLDFSDVQRFKFTARRVRRADLIAALTAALAREGVEVRYGMRATGIRDEAGRPARVAFADGSAAEADLVLGCDGIHSAVRTLRVDPARAPAYTGIATATGVAPAEQLPGRGADLPFDATSLYSGRRGSVLLSRFEPGSRDDFRSLYVGAVMETPPPADDEDAKAGWRARGADAEALRRDIVARFSGDDVGAEWPRAAVAAVEQWVLFPVYKLPPRGAWWRGRCLLLGDAAHAVRFFSLTGSLSVTDESSRCHRRARASAWRSRTSWSSRACWSGRTRRVTRLTCSRRTTAFGGSALRRHGRRLTSASRRSRIRVGLSAS